MSSLKIAFFSSQPYDKVYFDEENKKYGNEIHYFDTHLGEHSLPLLKGFDVACVFVNDKLNASVLQGLADHKVKWVLLRCAGFNQLDQAAAKKLGIRVFRVPEYSPYSVAEHALALILSLNRKIHKSYSRVREQNFSLEGLLGFDLHGKTVGVIGTGRIGSVFAKQMLGLGCRVISYDPVANQELLSLGIQNLGLDEIWRQSDIISLHCPLISGQNEHLINTSSINKMKPGVMLINTSRGGLLDTAAVIDGLKTKQIGYLGIDVYELEERIFFRDLTSAIIDDDLIQRLVSFPNVLVTAHQAFFTKEALKQISAQTLLTASLLKNKEPIPKHLELS